MSAGGVRTERARVLLTGAAGYIGAHVHRALRAAGHEVIAVDIMADHVHGVDVAAPQGVSAVDIRDAGALEQLLRGVDVVCHLAAAVPVPELADLGRRAEKDTTGTERAADTTDPESQPIVRLADGPDEAGHQGGRREESHGAGGCGRGPGGGDGRVAPVGRSGWAGVSAPGMQGAPIFVAHNDVGTALLLAAMERAKVRRLVLASSVVVYGEGKYRVVRDGVFFPGMRRRRDLDRGMFDHRAPRTGDVMTWEPVGEDAPLRPRSAYAASKVAQENYAMAWVASAGLSATVLRYHHVYGDPIGGAVRSAESGVVAKFRAELLAGRAPHIFEDGGQVRDFVHVRDIAAATVTAVERALPGFAPLNIASGRPVTIWEVASIMSKALGGPDPIVTGQYRLTDVRHLIADPERARHALNFTPRIMPTQGLAAYATSTADRR